MNKHLLSALVIIGSLLLVFSGCSTSQKEQVVQIQEIADANLPREIIGKDGAPMVLIPAGEFRMGSNHGHRDERPVHTVYLDAFYMDKYEVTNAQYRRFVRETAHREPKGWRGFKPWYDDDFNGDDHPLVCVKWEDAKAYAKWAGKRLPTEAEWEKAARGGLPGRKYPWIVGELRSYHCNSANEPDIGPMVSRDIWKYTAPVGSFPPNRYGLYNIAGNVSEWCADWYDSGYYAKSPRRNPTGPRWSRVRQVIQGGRHVSRGGSWAHGYSGLRLAKRSHSRYRPNKYLGFRCVVSASIISYDFMEDNTEK